MAQDPALARPIPSLEEIGTPLISPVEEGPPDVIPGLLPRRGQLVIAGETDVGKSLVALEICSTLSTGVPLWGELEPTMVSRKILYVLGEHYNEVIQRLWQVTKLPMSDQVFIIGPDVMGYDKWLVANGKPNPQAIEKFKVWTEGCDLVVFDPFSAFVTGVDVENDNVQMRLALDTMSYVAHQAGASCIVLAHKGKPMMDKTGKEHSRSKYAIRGASAIEDAATNIFYMARSEGQSEAAKRAGGAKIFSLACRKYKGVAPPEYTLLRDNQTLVHSILGNRPFHEVMKLDTLGKIALLEGVMGDMGMQVDKDQAVKIIAAMTHLSETQLKSWLRGKQ